MKKTNWFTVSMATALMTCGVCAADKPAQTPTPSQKSLAVAVKVQTLCPVMGGTINKSKFVDYDGKRIYVCCDGCIDKVKKDPAKYVRQMEEKGITLDKAESPKTE